MSTIVRRIAAALCSLTLVVVTPSVAGAAAGFGDVADDTFYTEAVQWMVDEAITTGTAPGCFSPNAPATRAEVAVFLHRLAGEPAGGSEPFADVEPGRYYTEAIAWMASTGITTGTSPTTFNPERLVTRAEVATFMHRIAGSPSAGSEPFVDVNDGDFYAVPVAWMVDQGITTGTSPSTFSPGRAVTRAEIATFMYRSVGSPAVAVEDGGVCSTDEFAALLEAEQRSFDELNALRVGLGLAPLTRTNVMDDFARNWSYTMHETRDFEHSSGPYGENIAWWSAGSADPTRAADVMHDLWVNSSGHYRNMTHSRYTQVGVGFWQGPGGWYATHVFR
ncbi:MAG: S-layer homology domain-containing protein [Actinomycetota bacterium]